MQSFYGNNIVYEEKMNGFCTDAFLYTYVFLFKTMDDGGYVEPTG